MSTFGVQANLPVQRGKVLGQKHSSGSNVEPLGAKGGSHLAERSKPPSQGGRGRGGGQERGRGRGAGVTPGSRGGKKNVIFSL